MIPLLTYCIHIYACMYTHTHTHSHTHTHTHTLTNSSSNQPITDISCGDGHNLALSSTGVVYSWGDNSVSQLGLSVSYTEVTKPRQVNIPSGFQVSGEACGANFSAALTSEWRFMVT